MLTLFLIIIPLLGGIFTLTLGKKTSGIVALLATMVEFALVLYIWRVFKPDAGLQMSFNYPWIASAGISFAGGLDGISLLLVFLTAFLCPLIVLSANGGHYADSARFYALILFMESALIGVFTATDAFLFYVFFEAALIPVYFLAAIWGGVGRIQITLKFFVYTMFGSLFMLLALIYLYFQTPGYHSSEISAFYGLSLSAAQQSYLFCAFFLAFAIKMPLFPFHTWQPDTYTESPTPATMLLAGIMSKMGVYGLIRLLIPIAPMGVERWGLVAIILSVFGALYGSVIAIQQRDIKRLVAYSSFAHMGLIAAGAFTLTTYGLQGSMIQMLSHGINVVGLLYIVQLIYTRTETRYLEQLGGISQSAPVLAAFFMLLLLGSVGLPLTNGFIGEFLLLSGVFEYQTWLGIMAAILIILGAVYMLRFYQKAMLGNKSEATAKVRDLNITELAILTPLLIMVLWIGLYPNTFLKITEPSIQEILRLVSR